MPGDLPPYSLAYEPLLGRRKGKWENRHQDDAVSHFWWKPGGSVLECASVASSNVMSPQCSMILPKIIELGEREILERRVDMVSHPGSHWK